MADGFVLYYLSQSFPSFSALVWYSLIMGLLADRMVKNPSASAGDVGLIPGSGRSPGEGKGNPLQYSHLVNPMDRGAWWATVHRETESDLGTDWGTEHALFLAGVEAKDLLTLGHILTWQQGLGLSRGGPVGDLTLQLNTRAASSLPSCIWLPGHCRLVSEHCMKPGVVRHSHWAFTSFYKFCQVFTGL